MTVGYSHAVLLLFVGLLHGLFGLWTTNIGTPIVPDLAYPLLIRAIGHRALANIDQASVHRCVSSKSLRH